MINVLPQKERIVQHVIVTVTFVQCPLPLLNPSIILPILPPLLLYFGQARPLKN